MAEREEFFAKRVKRKPRRVEIISHKLSRVRLVGMQGCGDVMIVSMGDQCMKLSCIFVGQRRFPLLFVFYHHLEIITQSIKSTVERLSYIFHDSSISRDPHLLTRLCEKFPSKT